MTVVSSEQALSSSIALSLIPYDFIISSLYLFTSSHYQIDLRCYVQCEMWQ